MYTSIRVTKETRDALSELAEGELGGASLEEALRLLLFEHQTAVALSRLDAEEYRAEAQSLAEADVEVRE